MDETVLLPLEKVFKTKATTQNGLPFPNEYYFDRYISIVNHLRSKVYPLVDAGLSALSEDNGLYTLHGQDHFDDVVRYAGLMLGCEKGSETLNMLTAYELYVLLLAIRMHDAGNMFGREGHEKRVFQMLKEMGHLSGSDDFEKRFIADISEAHGGKTVDGNKDTIGRLPNKKMYGSAEIRPRALAALVRFADEICESRSRAAEVLLQDNAVPKKNEIFHKYASSIKSINVRPVENEIKIGFAFGVEDAMRKWGKGVSAGKIEDVFLWEEILDRLDKMFLERQYCSRHMSELCQLDRLRINVEIFDPKYQTVKEIRISNEEEGYPENVKSLRQKYFDGDTLQRELSETVQKEN